MNLPLKLSLLKAGRTQRSISAATQIPENRISQIVCEWVQPTDLERQRIAGALGVAESSIFPSAPVDAVAVNQPAGVSA